MLYACARPGRIRLIAAATLTLAAASFLPAAAAQTPLQPVPVFQRPAGLPAALLAQPDPRSLRSQLVSVDVDGIAGAAADGRPLFLDLFPDARVVAARDRVDDLAPGRYVWSGHVVDGGEGLVTLAVNGRVMAGQIWIGSALYSVRSAGGGLHRIEQIETRRFPDEIPPMIPGGVAVPDVANAGAGIAGVTPMASDDGSVLDVMVVYTPAARVKAGGTSAIVALIDSAIANANTAYGNSGVTERLRLVHAEEVSYTESGTASGDFATDLTRLTSTSDGYMDSVHALRNTYGADFVELLIDNVSSCGIGWLMQTVSTGFESYAFTVADQSCAATNLTLAHELGHNMGLAHDVANATSAGAFSYAYGYQDPGYFRTVMAYACPTSGPACPRVPNFSTHTRTYGGRPTGVANQTENARALNNTASTTANFRAAIQTCTFTLLPTSATLGGVGGSGTVTVTTTSGCPWGATSNASFIALGATGGTGSGALTYTVAANTGAVRSGTITIGGQAFTVNQQSALPTLTPSPSALRFGAINTGGGTLAPYTSSQDVTLAQSGTGTVTWTATSDQPWLQVTSGSGTGNGKFTVRVISSGVLPPTGIVTGTITIAATGAQSNPTVPVYMTLYAPGTTTAPFGVIDTPAGNSSGIVGAIGVTGWALDDIQVQKVEIWRDPITGIDPGAAVQPNGKIYIGDAAFLAGARPDVEAAFPNNPLAYRGGWGYLMLTNAFPHRTNMTPAGGQGAFTIYAYAIDYESRSTLLGSRRISLDNDHAAKPFGAIDTPSQGGTWSGVQANFGWALTPGTALIPRDGSTMWVFLDSVSVGHPTYDQCRGVNAPNPPGNAVGACDDDVATLFAGRTNITQGKGAIGSYVIDTRALSNGLHTVAWSVTDDQGRVEGIGSRFFTVFNASGDAASAAAPVSATGDAPADVALLSIAPEVVTVRQGFDLGTPPQELSPGADGVRVVRMPELGRVEVNLGGPGPARATYAGLLQVPGGLRSLPPGSTLDPETGVFSWAPPPGYVGSYAFQFLRRDPGGAAARVPVTVQIVPKPGRSSSERLWIDMPSFGAAVEPPFAVAGWALDVAAWAGTGVDAVHVWAYPDPGSGDTPVFLGVADLGGARPDVAQAFGPQFGLAGYGLVVNGLPPGPYEIVVYGHSVVSGEFSVAKSVRVEIR